METLKAVAAAAITWSVVMVGGLGIAVLIRGGYRNWPRQGSVVIAFLGVLAASYVFNRVSEG